MKKKLAEQTIKELKNFCKNTTCKECPIKNYFICISTKDEDLETEIEIKNGK